MTLTGTPFDYIIAFVAGVAVSFTPCVYPLIPVMAATVAGANTSGRRWGGFFLSLLYVLGVAVSYAILAVAAAMTGKVFGTLQNNPFVFLVVGNVILLFSLIMFDIVPFPTVKLGGRVSGRGKRAIFSLGFVSGFIVGPCTAPVLGTLLFYIASRQNLFFGVSLLFLFALGCGTSLVLAGTFSGFLASLPRAGAWMGWIKKTAGFVLLVLAEYYLLKAGRLF